MFAPCATSGCTELPLFAHERCLRHVRCVVPRRGRWNPDACRECAPLLKGFHRDRSAPSPLAGMWSIIKSYVRQVSSKTPCISDPKLQVLLECKTQPAKRKARPSSSATDPATSATNHDVLRDDSQQSVGPFPTPSHRLREVG